MQRWHQNTELKRREKTDNEIVLTSRKFLLNSDLAFASKSDNSLPPEKLNECVDDLDRDDLILPSSESITASASSLFSLATSLQSQYEIATR